MKLNQLMEMVAIVETGSLRAAARQLDLAQPAMTRSVRSLERELGVPLFERDTKGMTLTPLGKLFHQRASSIVNEVRRAREELQQTQGDMQGTVVAGLSIMPHVGMLPAALPEFSRRYPKVKLKLIEGLYPAIESGLRDGSIDFYMGATPTVAPAPGLIVETLFENTRSIVARKGHALADARSIRELANAQWATTSIDRNAEFDLDELFTHYKMPKPEVMLQADSALSVMVALAHSDLLALLPVQWNAFPLTRDTLTVIEVKEKIKAPSIVLIRRPDLPLTPAAEYLCDLMKRSAPN